MAKIPVQDQIVEVSIPEFLEFLRLWAKGVKDFGIGCINAHLAGLADFNGKYVPKMIEAINTQSEVIGPEITNEEIIPLFRELLDLTDKVWNFEQEIIEEYSKTVSLDISSENNRKKLQGKVHKYRFGDTSHGVSVTAPESVLEISRQSIQLIPELEKIAIELDLEIERLLQLHQ